MITNMLNFIQGDLMAYSAHWKQILDEVSEFNIQNSGIVWYRGLSNSTHELNSGLFRLKLGNDITAYINLEEQMYKYFKNLGHLLHSDEPDEKGWKLLYTMQHHGVRTRLLDWSESFSVALFFATRNWKSENACIWLLNPTKLNKESISREEIISPLKMDYWEKFSNPEQKTIAIYPIKNNLRITAQHGVFTVQGNSLLPLDKEFGKLFDLGGIKKIVLPITVREDALNYLRQNGVNYFSIFPDLDGLAKHINELHIQPSWED